MNKKRNVILYIAASVDGFIAKENEDIDWLSMVERPGEDYGYETFIESVDTIIMGRKTYDKVLSFGIEFPHKDKKCYVISRTKTGHDDNVEFYGGDLKELIQKLKSREGKNIFIDGGAEVVRELKSLNVIDEYVISFIPIMLGKGIRLFKETEAESKLELVESRAFESGLVQVTYKTI
ncbi:dihydrofolate reductase family protein [Fictibacillus sp. b24]|uniref:dihydrofolate reductase family protein n=1 Tax=Fictibacillus sp. b24 TaxID=3055863 RepID=UPI0025A16751|nr:dihydrofolate reductase family protein [Fictibacillus sp. b24]MDM5317098.1 dihydrofolate reductase family protein [Fictibacillus sp. b24]